MGMRDHQANETHARDARAKREKRRRSEQSENWGRDDFMRDLGQASRLMSAEISADPTEAAKLREARRQSREGELLSDIDEDVS